MSAAVRVAGIDAMSPIAQDIVVTGHDRDEIGFPGLPQHRPNAAACARLGDDAPVACGAGNPDHQGARARRPGAPQEQGGGSSTYPTRAMLMAEPPSVEHGEITDKGYINQRAVLTRRADRVWSCTPTCPIPASFSSEDAMTDKLVTHSLDGLVYTITLSRPAKRNAISDRLLDALEKAWEARPAEARVVILLAPATTSAPGSTSPSTSTANPSAYHAAFAGLAPRLRQDPPDRGIPVVAVLHGAVIGGGLELATSTPSASPNPAPSTSCPKAATASMSAAAPRCAWRASSAPAAWPR
jgi:hypothetical protein